MSDNKICNNEYACPMDYVSAFANADTGVVYNLYQCTKCGMLSKV